MAGNGIGVSLQVDGETKFKNAMKNAAKAVSDVDSRLKLATAEFKKNGDAQKLMQTRSKTLNEEIKRQTQIVNSLDDALKTTERQYGENSTQALHYEAQLNRARQKLVQMQSALDNNAEGLDENGRAFEEAGDQAEKAAISFSDLSQAISNIQGIAKTAATAVINFAKSAWNAVANSSEWADNLMTMSIQTGYSVEQLQRYSYAAQQVDTDVETIMKSMAKMANPSGEMSEALRLLGVRTSNIIGSGFSGSMANYVSDAGIVNTAARSTTEIFWDTIDALNKLDANSQKTQALRIFGEEYTKLIPLIQKGRAGWEAAGNELDNVVNEEKVQQLATFNDKLNSLNAEIEGLKNNIFAELSPGFTKMADGFEKLIEKFNEWATSDSGQAALKGLSDAIGNIVDSIGEDDFETLVETATKIIEKLAGAINSITSDPSGIINSVKGALAGYATLSVSKQVLSLLTLLRSLGGTRLGTNISSVFGDLGNLFGGGGSGTSSAGGGLGTATLPVKIVNTAEVAMLLAAGVESAINMGKEVTENHSFLGIDLDKFWPKDKQLTTHPKAWYEHLTDGLNHWNEQANELGNWADSKMLEFGNWVIGLFSGGDSTSSTAGEEWRDPMTGMTQAEIEAAAAQYMKTVTSETQQMAETAATETVTTYSEELNSAVQEQETSWLDVFTNSGANAGGAFAAGLTSAIPSISGAVSRINAVVATIGATGGIAGGGKVTNTSNSRTNNIFINNLNQANAADIYDTLRNMNGAQEIKNRGYGYMPA